MTDNLRTIGHRLQRIRVALFLLTTVVDAAEPTMVSNAAVLHLSDGGYVSGRLADSEGNDSLQWQSPLFTSEFRFDAQAVHHIEFPPREIRPRPDSDYCFELAAGDRLYGSLVSVQEQSILVDAVGQGQLIIDRAVLGRVFRWRSPAGLSFLGPGQLKDWESAPGWYQAAGQLICDQYPGPPKSPELDLDPNKEAQPRWLESWLRRNIDLPPQAMIELIVTSRGRPDFDLRLAGEATKFPFRLEVWEDTFVVVRTTRDSADLASVLPLPTGPGRIHWLMFLDQVRGRILICDSHGRQLADLTAPTVQAHLSGSLQLTNKFGDLRIERIGVGPWNGEPPRNAEPGQSRLLLNDGSFAYGRITSYDALRKEFVIGAAGNESRIPEDHVRDIVFAEDRVKPPRSWQAETVTGIRITGDLVKVGQNQICLKSPGIREEISIPIDALESLIGPAAATTSSQRAQRTNLKFPVGRLEAPGLVLHGSLVETETEGSDCLIWKPVRSRVPSPLRQIAAARIYYRDPQRKRSVPDQRGDNGASSAIRPQCILHIVSGDKIPVSSVGIDADGVTFVSSVTECTTLGHNQIRFLELAPQAPATQPPPNKMQRMLVLPRMQRNDPPTHFVQSLEGDWLRGRVDSMDQSQIDISMRLESRRIPRDRVARIVWLPPDVLAEAESVKRETTHHEDVMLVRAVPGDRSQLTFLPQQVSGTLLSGRNDALGNCRVDLRRIDELRFGTRIAKDSSPKLAFEQWKLRPAIESLPLDDGSDDTEAGLVGKAAPEIQLDLIGGKPFRLSDDKGKIVVLDFWASWCGPCLQTMPQIEQVVGEFREHDVRLFGINLEETAERAQAALDRLKLTMSVALDRNGRIAAKYGATSIPMTVIVGRDGNVARIFVGGGPRFGEKFRDALNAIVAGKPTMPD